MSATTHSRSPDAELLVRIVQPEVGDWTPEAARSILAFDFPASDHARMRELSRRANERELTPDERLESESFLRVGDLLALLRAKATLSLQRAGQSIGK